MTTDTPGIDDCDLADGAPQRNEINAIIKRVLADGSDDARALAGYIAQCREDMYHAALEINDRLGSLGFAPPEMQSLHMGIISQQAARLYWRSGRDHEAIDWPYCKPAKKESEDV